MIYKGKSYSEKQVGGPQEKKKKKAFFAHHRTVPQ